MFDDFLSNSYLYLGFSKEKSFEYVQNGPRLESVYSGLVVFAYTYLVIIHLFWSRNNKFCLNMFTCI